MEKNKIIVCLFYSDANQKEGKFKMARKIHVKIKLYLIYFLTHCSIIFQI